MAEFVQTIIVGGGQAGLSLSYYLTRQGRDHVVLEHEPTRQRLAQPSLGLLCPQHTELADSIARR